MNTNAPIITNTLPEPTRTLPSWFYIRVMMQSRLFRISSYGTALSLVASGALIAIQLINDVPESSMGPIYALILTVFAPLALVFLMVGIATPFVGLSSLGPQTMFRRAGIPTLTARKLFRDKKLAKKVADGWCYLHPNDDGTAIADFAWESIRISTEMQRGLRDYRKLQSVGCDTTAGVALMLVGLPLSDIQQFDNEKMLQMWLDGVDVSRLANAVHYGIDSSLLDSLIKGDPLQLSIR